MAGSSALRDNYNSTVFAGGGVHGSCYSYRNNSLDLDPTYEDRFGRKLMRMTMDFHDNELKMSAYLTNKYAEIIQRMGAAQVVKQPRKGPYDIKEYQTSHVCGGAIMGVNPGDSALNTYLQSWDVPNLFVTGMSSFPQNAGYNPTNTVGALAFRTAEAIRTQVSEIPGTAGPCVARSGLGCWRASCLAPWPPRRIRRTSRRYSSGKYLATLGDCAACHTALGGQPFAGGLPVQTPFGVVVSPNITPDPQTGIGAWSNADFLNGDAARHRARRKAPVPGDAVHQDYTHVTAADDLAIRAWLATIPPVRHAVVSNKLPFPLDIRASMTAWNALFFSAKAFRPDPSKSVAWNRGSYLVNGLGHCGACHTPKNPLGADQTGEFLRGARLQGWFAPNITNDDRRGLGRWSSDDVVAYLRTGHNRFAAASGPMAQEVSLSSSQWSDADLRAAATYLKDQPGQHDAQAPVEANSAAMRQGAAIYADECSACHTPQGQGIPNLFPALNAAPAIQSRAPTSLIRVVLHGAKSVATERAPTGPAMPAFGWMLSDAQVASVVTYIRNAWGNAASAVSADQVASARKERAEQ